MTERRRTRRNPWEISAALIGSVSSQQERKTKMMFAAGINLAIVNKYLRLLTNNGLIWGSGTFFTATEKGVRYLKSFQDYEAANRLFREKQNALKSYLQFGAIG